MIRSRLCKESLCVLLYMKEEANNVVNKRSNKSDLVLLDHKVVNVCNIK